MAYIPTYRGYIAVVFTDDIERPEKTIEFEGTQDQFQDKIVELMEDGFIEIVDWGIDEEIFDIGQLLGCGEGA